MDIISAYREVGTYRGAAAICGTTPKTVKRVIARHESGGARAGPAAAGAQLRRGHRAGGRAGGEDAGPDHARSGCCRRRGRRATRGRRGTSGGWSRSGKRCGARTIIVVDGRRCGPRVSIWSSTGGCWAGCTCSARCWRGAGCGSCGSPHDERADTTLALLAECFETLGGVPGVVLADRMGCLKGGVVANKVVPTGEYVRFAAHYGFRPDFCEAADPESKGIVENLVGYAKTDLMIPGLAGPVTVRRPRGGERGGCGVVCRGQRRGALRDLRGAGRAAGHRAGAAGPVAVAAGEHRQVGDPQGRPAVLCPVRLGALLGPGQADRHPGPAAGRPRPVAGRSSPATGEGEVVAEHLLVAPGEASILDEHYGGPRPAPRRAVRPKTAAEKAFCALGPAAEAFLTGAAAAGNTRLGPELAELNTLAAAHGERGLPRRPGPGGRVRPLAGRGRAVHPRRRHRDTAAHHRRGRPRARAAPRPDPVPVRLRHRQTSARCPAVGSSS